MERKTAMLGNGKRAKIGDVVQVRFGNAYVCEYKIERGMVVEWTPVALALGTDAIVTGFWGHGRHGIDVRMTIGGKHYVTRAGNLDWMG